MDLSRIREDIDRVDRQIRALFEERMKLADQVARVKARTEDTIFKPDREAAIIKKQTEGIDSSILREYKALIKRIMEISRKYQYGRTMDLRDCFPYPFLQIAPDLHKAAMVKEELYACRQFSRDKVLTMDTFEEVGEAVAGGLVDAGIGILEMVGVGVSDELHNMLFQKDLHILSCDVQEDRGVRRKVVTFTRDLVVLPDHNRIRIMFECPNRYGSLASILSMISDYGVNLTEIHSRPFYVEQDSVGSLTESDSSKLVLTEKKDSGKKGWNYRFFAELEAHMDQAEIRAMIYQLSQETGFLKIMGSYACQGDFE